MRTRVIDSKTLRQKINNFLSNIEDYDTTLLIIKDYDGDIITYELKDTVCDTVASGIIIENELQGSIIREWVELDTIIFVDYKNPNFVGRFDCSTYSDIIITE